MPFYTPLDLDFFCSSVLSPTRELAIQISGQFEALGAEIGVLDMTKQAIQIAKKPHVIVGTPGRVLDHLNNTKGFSADSLKYLVLDEADRLLSEDFAKKYP
ncbi:hypothetical protein K1719_017464 [Acacia pycnantha]|nr:hypothetical protein K1719_017464 [Acacia pycnantha]